MLVLEVMRKIKAMWPGAFGDGLDEWAEQYKKHLLKYEGPELQAAFDATVARATHWPKPHDILANIETRQELKNRVPDDLSKRRAEELWAEKVMQTPEGRQACREGFARELYCWAVRNRGRYPADAEIERMRQSQARVEAVFAAIGAERPFEVGEDTVFPSADMLILVNAAQHFEGKLRERFGGD